MGKDTLEEAIEGLNNRIEQIVQTESDNYIGFLTRGKCFRYNIARSKPYKHNRKYGSKPLYTMRLTRTYNKNLGTLDLLQV